MRKVNIGDEISSYDFGSGIIVAMTEQWCIFSDKEGVECALPWAEVFISPEPAVLATGITEKNIGEDTE